MKAHDLAQKLLDGPNNDVWYGDGLDYPLKIVGVSPGVYFDGDSGEDDEGQQVICLAASEDDGVLESRG